MSNFNDVVGHERIVKHLKNAIIKDKPSHAYIFSGEDGVGKRTVAELFAKGLLCSAEGERPCGVCKSCVQFDNRNHPDVMRVTHEKTAISVDDVRNQLVSEMQVKPYVSRYKVFLVDEAEKMNEAAQNALLKTFEEPPEYGIIILLTNNLNTMLETIRSRAVALSFFPARTEDIVEYLAKEMHIPSYQAEMAAAISGGVVGLACKIADSEEYTEKRDLALDVLRKMGRLDFATVIALSKDWGKKKDFIEFFIPILKTYVRDILLVKATGKTEKIVYKPEEKNIRSQAYDLSYERLSNILKEADRLMDRLKANVNAECALEDFLLNLIN